MSVRVRTAFPVPSLRVHCTVDLIDRANSSPRRRLIPLLQRSLALRHRTTSPCLRLPTPGHPWTRRSTEEVGADIFQSIGDDDAGNAEGDEDVAGEVVVGDGVVGEVVAGELVSPRVVSATISLLLPHLDAEPYALRSEIAKAIGHILVREEEKDDEEEKEGEKEEDGADGGEEKEDVLSISPSNSPFVVVRSSSLLRARR